jgi:hypothetical protein
MPTNIVDGDLLVRGRVVPESMTIPAGSVVSDSIQAAANLNADKLEQREYVSHAQPNSAATTETRTLFVARRAGTVNEVIAGSIAIAIGDSTVTVDVKKNGTTILSAVITLDSANTARLAEVGTLSGSGAFVADDWFEVVITATIGTGTLPTGVFVQLECDQDGA